MNLKQLKQEFDQLTPQQQYEWLMKQDKSLFMIYLDNDATELLFHADTESDYVLTFKRYLGSCDGIELLLIAMGIEVQFV